jgi:hypothetical protein
MGVNDLSLSFFLFSSSLEDEGLKELGKEEREVTEKGH